MINKKEIKNIVEVENIMTIKINTVSKRSDTASLESWDFGIEDEGTKTGRTLEELKSFITAMTYVLHGVDRNNSWSEVIMCSNKTILCHIYTHEAAYVFHWLRNIFSDNMSVFTNTMMSPITADITINNVIFRMHDTERLVNRTLEEWANDEELKGDIVMEGIKKYRDRYKTLYDIPLTQAGEVRRLMKFRVNDADWINQTKETIKSYDFDTYKDLVRCFMGGTLGVNDMYRGMLLNNVYSDDLGSAYPGVMAVRKFPVSPWENSSYDRDPDYRYYLEVEFKNVKSKYQNKFYPFKKCYDGEGQIDDGIGLESANELTLVMTDIDFEIFKQTYDCEYEIKRCRRSKAEYLPKQLVKLILEFYGMKTELKGTDRVSEYRHAKISNNCVYGVAVTKTITDDIVFEKGEWKKKEIKTEEDFNKKRDELLQSKQILSYQIGVWVTAYVRAIMWSIIPEIDNDVVYFDTDCIKHLNDTDIFDNVNKAIMHAIKVAAAYHGIDTFKFCPKNKPIGCFEKEDFCHEFKAIKVKCYAKRTDKGVDAVISGLPKDRIKLKNVDDLNGKNRWSAEESGVYNVYYNEGKQYTVSRMPAPFSLSNYTDVEMSFILAGHDYNINKTTVFRAL